MSLRVTDLPDWLTSTLASDARGGDGALPGWIRPLRPGQHTIGVASTATLAGGDNLGLRQAIEKGPAPGTVLVAFGSMTGDRAVIGDVLGNWLLARGFTALITDGLVRDSARLAALGLPVWCRGPIPVGSTHQGPGRMGVAVDCGGVVVEPGDVIVADDDGVVTWPARSVGSLVGLAEARMVRDESRIERVRRGLAPD